MHLVRPDPLRIQETDMLYKGDTLYLDWWKMALPNWYLMPQVQLINSTCHRRQPRRGHRRAGTAIRSKGLLLRSNKAAFIVGADITEFCLCSSFLKNS